MAEGKEPRFDEQLQSLEEIVAKIDSGELTLEESIDAFERGVTLVKALNQKLDEAERKVEVLVKDAQGGLRTVPYAGAGGKGDDGDEPF